MGSDLPACPLSSQFLAMVFQDLLTNKDDYLRASRALLREIIKQTKHEVNFQAFCLGLMQERKEPQYLDMEFKVPQLACPSPPTLRGLSCHLWVASRAASGQSQRAAWGPFCVGEG